MKKPNILFLFPDQHRKEWFPYQESVYENWNMKKPNLNLPNMERLMGEGVTFLNAITPSPLCAPARACLASGTRYYHCETPGNNCDYPLDKPTIYQAMRDVGYEVLGVGKFDLRKFTCDWFNEENQKTLGFTSCIDSEGKMDAVNHYKRYGYPRGPYMKFLEEKGYDETHANDIFGRKRKTHRTPLPDEVYCDNWIAQNAIDLIGEVPEGKPWFMQVNFNGPHSPFDVTEKMFETVKDKDFELAHDGEYEENAVEIRQCYAAMIENIDRNIGLILDLLEERGELDNTMIVYASDHGEMLGDHGRYSKSVPFRGSMNIPMVAVLPQSGKKGVYETAIVELQDLTSTFAQVAGANLESAFDSKSLVPILIGESDKHRDYGYSALSTTGDMGFQCIVNDQYKYIEYDDETKALYDMKNDSWEDNNLIEEKPEIAAQLSVLLRKNQ